MFSKLLKLSSTCTEMCFWNYQNPKRKRALSKSINYLIWPRLTFPNLKKSSTQPNIFFEGKLRRKYLHFLIDITIFMSSDIFRPLSLPCVIYYVVFFLWYYVLYCKSNMTERSLNFRCYIYVVHSTLWTMYRKTIQEIVKKY